MSASRGGMFPQWGGQQNIWWGCIPSARGINLLV
jgi:hypothetical protein